MQVAFAKAHSRQSGVSRWTGPARGGKTPGMAIPLVVAGGIMGRPVTAAAMSGGINFLQELGPERIQGAADRTTKAISEGAGETGKAAKDVLESAGQLAKQSESLREAVDKFLVDIRAA